MPKLVSAMSQNRFSQCCIYEQFLRSLNGVKSMALREKNCLEQKELSLLHLPPRCSPRSETNDRARHLSRVGMANLSYRGRYHCGSESFHPPQSPGRSRTLRLLTLPSQTPSGFTPGGVFFRTAILLGKFHLFSHRLDRRVCGSIHEFLHET